MIKNDFMRRAFTILSLLLCFCSVIFASDETNSNLKKYDALFKRGDYKSITSELGDFINTNESDEKSSLTEPTIIHLRNLLADSYRMLGKYHKASKWYILTADGHLNAYAGYCFKVFEKSSFISIDKDSKKPSQNPFLHYDGELGSNPLHEETLLKILVKFYDSTSPMEKRLYFQELVSFDKNNDWITQLTKFCAGSLSIKALLSVTPKENTSTTYTYAGFSLEAAGEVVKARDLYQKALEQRVPTNIDLLLARNRLGLFALKMIYSTTDKGCSLTDIYAIKASSVKLGKNSFYSVRNIIDEDSKTAWVPDSKKSGIGQWIEFSFDDPMPVNTLIIVNGYAKSNETFKNNNRVKSATIVFSDGSKQKISLQDTMEPQEIKIVKITQKIRISINEVYKGIKYDDTCLSEINVQFNKIVSEE
jgi:tetratricopeptide (TPR) repeat protein